MSYCRMADNEDGQRSDVYCLGSYIDEAEVWVTHVCSDAGLKHDGKTYQDVTLGSFKTTLLYLRRVGYNVPQCALDRIEAELLEASTPS